MEQITSRIPNERIKQMNLKPASSQYFNICMTFVAMLSSCLCLRMIFPPPRAPAVPLETMRLQIAPLQKHAYYLHHDWVYFDATAAREQVQRSPGMSECKSCLSEVSR